ncbi:MAG: ATP-dependent Clp protease adapter ClpS [Pseudomonadota bacterium]|jgi:ATP-dependent Clp protease adaptor protein ClpS
MSTPKKPKQSNPEPLKNNSSAPDEALVLERVTWKTKPPRRYQVVMLNDDFTPMEFVVLVLQEYFHKDRESATHIMLKIHLEGKAICGVFPRDIASTKVEQVLSMARQQGHPLQCIMEPTADA